MKVLSDIVIREIHDKSKLKFEQAKDFNFLAQDIFDKTGRSIGVNTLKRLMGQIGDAREATKSTLNTIAAYLGADNWDDYNRRLTNESQIAFRDDTVYVNRLSPGQKVSVWYLNRYVVFEVERTCGGCNALRVINVNNGSLLTGDLAFVHSIRKGCVLEADRVVRGNDEWNYRTQGEVTEVKVS